VGIWLSKTAFSQINGLLLLSDSEKKTLAATAVTQLEHLRGKMDRGVRRSHGGNEMVEAFG
jgi:hypothetical protein